MKIEVVEYGGRRNILNLLRVYQIVLEHFPNPPGTYAFCNEIDYAAVAVLTGLKGSQALDSEELPGVAIFTIPGVRAHELKDIIWKAAAEVYI